MEDPQSKKPGRDSAGAGGHGVGVPAKGDSSASNPPIDPLEGATISDAPAPTPTPPAKPTTRVVNPDATIAGSLSGLSTPSRPFSSIYLGPELLQPGDLIGGRYEILQLLGEGGMGAVYKARDREVERTVALKLIRPELASNPAILARFKQELLTAHQVTHKNVIRIYDLAEADGVKFITMEFVEGSDLRRILIDNGKLPPGRAIEIIRRVCLALDAAHSAGIIHRDLKPQNIMQDSKSGRILVMDFGLARSMESEGMTQTGALLGTIEYMSPEQSMGKTLDQRSDIFALGLIFYELLTGKTPYKADTAMASLLRRNQERAIPAAELDTSVPKGLSDIVSKCLERDLEHRYQAVQELLADLDAYEGARPTMASVPLRVTAPVSATPTSPWKWVAAGLAAVLLVAGGFTLRLKGPAKSNAPHAPVSVLVADFTNHTGDHIFDDTLEPMFNVALEGASFINAYNRVNARKLAEKLPNPTDKLDEQSSRLVAVSQGLGAVVTGSLSLRGDGYKLSVEALDARTGNSVANVEINARTKDDLLLGIPKLAAPIRKALGDTTPESVQLAASGPFTAASLEVVHLYNVGMEQQFAGKMDEALSSFSKAVELDPNFARAYSGMSGASAALGRQADGEKYVKLAMEHLDRMTERERYHTRAFFYYMTGDYPKCVEEYGSLVSQYPADRIGQANLSVCYSQLRNAPEAVKAARKAVEIVPNGAALHTNLSFLLSFGGDFQEGEREARRALEINPSMEDGYHVLAEAQLGQGQIFQATETYHKLEKLNDRGASIAGAGLADLAAYEGRFSEAVRLLERGATADLQAKRAEDAANKFARLAYTQLLRKEEAAAVAAADKAAAHDQSVQTRFLTGRIYAETGDNAKAQKLAASLGSELQAEPQAYAKIIEGKSALKQGDSRQAIKAFTDANRLLDTWIGRLELGRAYLEAGLFVEADSEFDRCIKRRGETLELFLDDVPTYSYFPLVYYYQGRAREELKSAAFAESYRTYLSIRGQAGEDPLLPEIRRRLGQ
jgi:serine/threonine protein kinase/tetratricopeptide (TPR) repeat protein